MRRLLFLVGLLPSVLLAQTITKLYNYGPADPDLVERQIRALVPEGPRVSVNRNAGQVIVVAEPEVQERVAAMVAQLARPELELRFRFRLNRDQQEVAVPQGVLFSIPVSRDPPQDVVAMARARLAPEHLTLPVVATALQAHPVLLRRQPAVVRLRLTPAVVFGEFQPYQVVSFDELAQDLLVDSHRFLDVSSELSSHDFYRKFLRTRTEPAANPVPVGLLLSFDAVPAGTEP